MIRPLLCSWQKPNTKPYGASSNTFWSCTIWCVPCSHHTVSHCTQRFQCDAFHVKGCPYRSSSTDWWKPACFCVTRLHVQLHQYIHAHLNTCLIQSLTSVILQGSSNTRSASSPPQLHLLFVSCSPGVPEYNWQHFQDSWVGCRFRQKQNSSLILQKEPHQQPPVRFFSDVVCVRPWTWKKLMSLLGPRKTKMR